MFSTFHLIMTEKLLKTMSFFHIGSCYKKVLCMMHWDEIFIFYEGVGGGLMERQVTLLLSGLKFLLLEKIF